MRDAENAVIKPPLHRAIQFRDGLMIAFLARRPLRLSNLATMTLERHLIRQASGYRLYFSGREVKGGKPIETSVPASLVGDFDRYLEHYRPILLTRGGRQRSSDCNAVWISRIAAALDYKAIPERVTKHTATAFGQPLWVHLFRDCAATTIATEDPTNVRSIIAILGHSTLAISEKYYNQARSLEASRRYQKIVEDWCSSFNERPPL